MPPFHATIRAPCDNPPHLFDVRQFNAKPSAGILRALCRSTVKICFFAIYRALQAPITMEGNKMADNNDDVPFMQKLLDNHWLLMVIGVVSPTILYTLWGIVDIMNTPLAK